MNKNQNDINNELLTSMKMKMSHDGEYEIVLDSETNEEILRYKHTISNSERFSDYLDNLTEEEYLEFLKR